jgi:hypothetical protein
MNIAELLSPVDNIREAYRVLHQRVIRSLLTQVGDVARLQETRSLAITLLQAAEPVRNSAHASTVISNLTQLI